jgi:hypothetical protein
MVSKEKYGDQKWERGDAPCIFDTRQRKKRSIISVIESSKTARVIPAFQDRMELENPGKAQIYKIKSNSFQRHQKDRTKLGPSPAGMTSGKE